LQNIPSGKIHQTDEIEKLLAQCWRQLGGDYRGMAGYKLLGRMEDVVWNPPLLTFRIERHGGTALGSVYAELQSWQFDVERGIASYLGELGRRLVGQRDKPLKTAPLANEIAKLILAGQHDPRLKWLQSGGVRVNINKVIPATVKQTTTSRRRRFRKDLQEEIGPHGWHMVRMNTFERVR
jgi:hypothetical protein